MYRLHHTNILWCYFQFFGIGSSQKTSHQLLPAIWSTINIAILLTIIASIVWLYHKDIFYDDDAIGAITDIIQMAIPFLAHYTLIAESIRTDRKRLKIRSIFERFDRNTSKYLQLNVKRSVRVGVRRYFVKALLTQSLCLITEIRIMSSISANKEWSNHWYASFFTFNACRCGHFQFIYFVDLLKIRMNIISMELGELMNGRRQPHCVQNKLTVLKAEYGGLWLAAELVNESFGWSALTNVTANFICLSVNLYWNYAAIYFGSNPYWMESLLGSFPIILILIVVCYSCEQCICSASRQAGVYIGLYIISFFFQIQKVISAVHRIEQTKYKIDLRTVVNLICFVSISVRKFTSLNSSHRFINFLCKLPIKNSISVPRDFFTLTTIFLVG